MRNIKIGTRLIVGSLTLIIFMVAVGFIGISEMRNLTDKITKFYNHPFTVSTSVRNINTNVVAIDRAILEIISSENNPQKINSAIKDIRKRQNTVFEELELVGERFLGDQQKVANASAAFRDWKALEDKAIQSIEKGEMEKAFIILNASKEESSKHVKKLESALKELDDFAMNKAISFEKTAVMESNSMTIAVGAISGIAAIIGLLIAFLIIRSIIKPINEVTSVAEKISQGDIEVEIERNSKDEIGDLMGSFSKMLEGIKQQSMLVQELSNGNLNVRAELRSDKDILSKSLNSIVATLSQLISEMNHMSEQHDLGDIDVMIDSSHFSGPYKMVAQSVNNMVAGHLSLKKKAMACIQEFANGNFDAKLETFPGKKVFINEGIEKLRENLKEVNKEINGLVDASVKGILSTRVDANKYNGDWEKLIKGLNSLLDAIVEPVQEGIAVLNELSNGNLSARVKGAYNGDLELIKIGLNSMGSQVQGYIEELTNNLSNMSEKNFTGGIEREYLGDFMALKNSINHIFEQFNYVLSEIDASAYQVETGADQVAASSQGLSQGASEQASSVEEISATITQVAEQAKENTTNANKANQLTIKAKTDAQNGDTQMSEMLEAMNEIKESSMNISNIIKVIDEIAFQTNILALNAAVEAARAGEHGKGFAVVAEEVRNLAARSAKAAKETTDLIDSSILKVEEGYKMANDTADALGKIVTGAGNSVEIVGMIAEASNEQAIAIGEINRGIEQISQITQSNTATAEESASASEEMAGHAQMLKGMMQEFQLKNKASIAVTKSAISSNQSNESVHQNQDIADIEISFDDDTFGKY